jgi:chromosome segregation ATPase
VTDDMRAQIASIRASLGHIERQLDVASDDRRAATTAMDGVRERLTRLEERVAGSADLPGRVAHNEQSDAARNAYREGAKDMMEELQVRLRIWLGVPGAIISITAIWAALRFTNGG